MKNIVKFAKGKDTAFLCGLFRYDYGQQLIIEGLELPDDFEVHFQTQGDTAPVIKGCKNGDEYLVSIPDEILQQAVDETKAWIYLDNKTSGKTIKTIVMHLNDRDKPSDYPLQEDVATVKGYAEYVKENAEKVSQAQAAGDRANTIADELIRAKENGEFNGKDAEPIAVDCKLSENSTNPIANSAVAKVLSGGKMAGVEVIYDYESFMDMFMKYCDSETGEFLLADDEFILVLALDDIYDESGEYGDDECLLKKALYFWTNYDMVAIGEVSNDDLFGITNELNEIRKLVMSRMTAHFIDASKNGGVYCGQFSAGLTQITKDGPLLSETSGEQLLLLKAGDTVFSNGKSLTYKVIVISSLDGCIHTFNKASDGIHSSQYIDKAETEEIIDSKLSEGKPNAIPQIFIDETTVTVQPNVYYCFGEVESLSIDFAPEKADCVNEYMFEFISGSIPTTLILPADIKWATDIDVTANKKYQVSILNNVGLMAGVDV